MDRALGNLTYYKVSLPLTWGLEQDPYGPFQLNPICGSMIKRNGKKEIGCKG